MLRKILIGVVIACTLNTNSAQAVIKIDTAGLPTTLQTDLNKYSMEEVEQINKVPGFEAIAWNATGTTDFTKHRILIAKNEISEVAETKTCYHEIGHVLDSYVEKGHTLIGEYSSTKEFRDICLAERSALLDSKQYYLKVYYQNSLLEYFAECFARYYTEPAELQKHCPRTFSYIDKIIQESR